MKKVCFCVFSYSALLALPQGGQVVQGEAAWSSSADALQIEARGKAILQWEGFDVASQEAVRFFQREGNFAILNRVVSASASEILGKLEANCPIYLVNPHGVFLGSAAVVETAGFIASTADLSNECFGMEGALSFQSLGAGAIVNLGKIHTACPCAWPPCRQPLPWQPHLLRPNP